MSSYIKETEQWISDFVIKHNLCPFAAHVFNNQDIAYALCPHIKLADIFKWSCQSVLDFNAHQNPTTAFLIFGKGLDNFDEYLDIYYALEAFLSETNLQERLQLASFHPDYTFADTSKRDLSNHTNRSPYPLIHILRTASVAEAISTHPNVEDIPLQNIQKMKVLFDS